MKKKPTILIAGVGYLGEKIAEIFLDKGFSVVGFTFSKESAQRAREKLSLDVLEADISSREALRRVKEQLVLEAPLYVIHCASSRKGGEEAYRNVYVNGCMHLQEMFSPQKMLFTSSTSVYAQTDGSQVTEESLTLPARVTGELLLAAEKEVLHGGGIVCRLSGIYGPRRSVLLKKFFEGTAFIEKGESRFLNQAHRDDIATAVYHLLTLQDAVPGIYNVTDDLPMTQRECYTKLSKIFQKPLPPERERDLHRKRGWTHKYVCNDKLRATGWAPQYASFFEAIERDAGFVESILQEIQPRGGESRN